jgi:translation initiation factor eIF-2B subunit delta
MVCRDLIEAIKILIQNTEVTNSIKLISEIREKVGKILNIINKLTHVIGGLDNSCKYIKKILNKIPLDKNSLDIKEALMNKLDEFINTKINTKDIIATNRGVNLIKENDCLLIYGKSKIYRSILTSAVSKGIKFKVFYTDNRQETHIKSEIEFLSKLGVSVVYSYVNGISGIIDKVTKVFIKAKSMLSNGNLLGAVGTSLISCIAYNFKKPVIAFSETYKFWDKNLMNSFSADNFIIENNYLNLLYDITPANYINMVVCELGYIPPTSVPVVIREFGQEDIEFD